MLDLSARLAEADALVEAGCFDCLRDGLNMFQSIRALPAALPAATQTAAEGAFRAAALLALRQGELGMVDDGYLTLAKGLLESHPCQNSAEGCAALNRLLDIVATLPASISGLVPRTPETDEGFTSVQRLFRNRAVWTSLLRGEAAHDVLSAYVWLALACRPVGELDAEAAVSEIGPLRDVPLLRYRRASCLPMQAGGLETLKSANARFGEIAYLLGQIALGGRKLDDADELFDEAYAWHPRWPTLTVAIANVAMTAEDFSRALTFYEHSLDLEPRAVTALLGKVRALTYLGRYEESIAVTDQLLTGRLYLGDARFWRAMDEYLLGRYEPAWADVIEASKLLVNAQVSKLSGLIAHRRSQLEVARAKFEEAMGLESSLPIGSRDCETPYSLGLVLAEQRGWAQSADAFVAAVACLQAAEGNLQEEIERIRQRAEGKPERQARQIASREERIASGRRMIATSSFNTAVAYFNLSRPADAKLYAQRVADDEQFGERAREILSRLAR